MSCYLCTGDNKPHPNRSDFKFMKELFFDFAESDEVCVSCFARLDSLIDYANTDLTTEAPKPKSIENVNTDHPSEAPKPKKAKTIPQANNKIQKILPKKVLQGGFTICKLSAEQLSKITITNFGNFKTKQVEIQTIDPSLLKNLNNLKFVQVPEGHMHETIKHALQRSMISNI